MFSPMPTKTLSNGIIVGNLTSGHSFEFEDGSILDACQLDRVDAGSIKIQEYVSSMKLNRANSIVRFDTIEMTPTLTDSCRELLDDALVSYQQGLVHVVIVPLMLLQAIKAHNGNQWRDFCYVIRKNGRDVDGQRAKVCVDRFCV